MSTLDALLANFQEVTERVRAAQVESKGREG